MSVITLTSGRIVPIHWNDRAYDASCPECGEWVLGYTPSELVEALEIHC